MLPSLESKEAHRKKFSSRTRTLLFVSSFLVITAKKIIKLLRDSADVLTSCVSLSLSDHLVLVVTDPC